MQVTPNLVLRDYCTTVVVVLFGAGLAAISLSYPLGRMIRPGPGFFPLVIGCLIGMLGLAVAAETRLSGSYPRATPDDEGVTPSNGVAWRPVLTVAIGMLAFAMLIDRAGYVAACTALIFISALGELRRSWWGIVVVALIMAVGGSILFVWGLGLPVRVFGSQ